MNPIDTAKLKIFRSVIMDHYKEASDQKENGVDYVANKVRMNTFDDVLLLFHEVFEDELTNV